jgi:putative Holliday junction resolvase
MRTLGLDIGDRRTGVAISDPRGILAIPLTVLAEKDEDATIDEILRLVEQYEAERIVVGLPRCLSGDIGTQASKVTAFTEKLRNAIADWGPEPCSSGHSEGEKRPKNLAQGKLHERTAKQSHLSRVDIQLWDERLSTIAAERLMIEAGTKRNKRKSHLDAMAAAFILQGFLDSLEDSSGSARSD